MNYLSREIVNGYQKNFPLTSRPFKTIADKLDVTEDDVITAFKELKNSKVLSRLGPVFNHKKAGASTLAAMSVPKEKLQEVAGFVSAFKQVNHNYEREHEINLWFVVTAPNSEAVQNVLQQIEIKTGYAVLDLPMETSYHIDLGFKIKWGQTND